MMLRYMRVLQVLIEQWLLLVQEHDDRRLLLDAEEPVRGGRAPALLSVLTLAVPPPPAPTDPKGARAQGPLAREAAASRRRACGATGGGLECRL